MMLIAIQPDNYGPNDSSSPLWIRYLQYAGHEVREVNVYASDIIEQLKGCHGFMWRHGHTPGMRQVARRLLPVLENQLGLAVYPDQKTCWHYDDKIAQRYLLEAADIPIPNTWILYEKEVALAWASRASYPIVMKLWAGAGSVNVRLVETSTEAHEWVIRVFDEGISSLNNDRPSLNKRVALAARALVTGGTVHPWELHKSYVYFQEFLKGNSFDTRITVIGNRAFGYRRFNRPDDFRASGSGDFDVSPDAIDKNAVKLAFSVAEKLGTQSIAIDGLKKNGQFVVGEISYTYVSWMVHSCPGHWDCDLNWHEGRMWPEEAQIQDFLDRLEARKGDALANE